MLNRRMTIPGICLVLLVACSDGAGPGEVLLDGTYVLRAVNGRGLPTTIAEGGGQQYIVLADTLRFSRNATVARSMAVRHLSATPEFYPADTTYHQVMSFPYVVESNRVIIGYRDPCPPNALCIGFEEGEFTPTGLHVVGRLFWSGDPILTFRRLP